MHIGRHIIQELSLQFGAPVVERWRFEMKDEEFARLRLHAERRRTHDVSLAIVSGDDVAVIRKPAYPPAAFRLPSGGIHPEEAFLDGAVREAYEETGLRVTFERYLLRAHVTFHHRGEESQWTSHVMLARPASVELHPMDTREIAEARWTSWTELVDVVNPVLRSTGLGGLAFRADLHERTRDVLQSQ